MFLHLPAWCTGGRRVQRGTPGDKGGAQLSSAAQECLWFAHDLRGEGESSYGEASFAAATASRSTRTASSRALTFAQTILGAIGLWTILKVYLLMSSP